MEQALADAIAAHPAANYGAVAVLDQRRCAWRPIRPTIPRYSTAAGRFSGGKSPARC